MSAFFRMRYLSLLTGSHSIGGDTCRRDNHHRKPGGAAGVQGPVSRVRPTVHRLIRAVSCARFVFPATLAVGNGKLPRSSSIAATSEAVPTKRIWARVPLLEKGRGLAKSLGRQLFRWVTLVCVTKTTTGCPLFDSRRRHQTAGKGRILIAEKDLPRLKVLAGCLSASTSRRLFAIWLLLLIEGHGYTEKLRLYRRSPLAPEAPPNNA